MPSATTTTPPSNPPVTASRPSKILGTDTIRLSKHPNGGYIGFANPQAAARDVREFSRVGLRGGKIHERRRRHIMPGNSIARKSRGKEGNSAWRGNAISVLTEQNSNLILIRPPRCCLDSRGARSKIALGKAIFLSEDTCAFEVRPEFSRRTRERRYCSSFFVI